jgi:hypothetical protein
LTYVRHSSKMTAPYPALWLGGVAVSANVPPAVREKAQRLERLLLRVGAGDALDEACAELGLTVEPDDLPALEARYLNGSQQWQVLVDGRYGHTQKANSAVLEWLKQCKGEQRNLTAGQLAERAAQCLNVELSAGHINYLLRPMGLTNRPGRPAHPPAPPPVTVEPLVEAPQTLENVGLFFPGRCQA